VSNFPICVSNGFKTTEQGILNGSAATIGHIVAASLWYHSIGPPVPILSTCPVYQHQNGSKDAHTDRNSSDRGAGVQNEDASHLPAALAEKTAIIGMVILERTAICLRHGLPTNDHGQFKGVSEKFLLP